MKFEAFHPLEGGHPAYTVREDVENEAIEKLREMRCLKLIEPRLQGKTSFINRLPRVLTDKVFVNVDLGMLDRSGEEAWYGSLWSRVLDGLAKGGLVASPDLPVPRNHSQWDQNLRKLAAETPKDIVLILDAIKAAGKFPGAADFFATLHAIYTSRGNDRSLYRIAFILAGSFNPRDSKVIDSTSDPLTIAEPVTMRDFTREEVCSLVSKGDWAADAIPDLADRIFFWTEGHPQLTQLLCANLSETATAESVANCVDDLRRRGLVRLHNILADIDAKPELRAYFDRILRGDRIAYYPYEIPEQRELQLLGVIKGDPHYCVVRSGIYRFVFHAKPKYDIFLSYRRLGGGTYAELIEERLKKEGWNVFFDRDSMTAGSFPHQLSHEIMMAPKFVPILSAGCFHTAVSGVDWMRDEITRALTLTPKCIVPTYMENFSFPPELPKELERLKHYEAVDFGRMRLSEAMDRLVALLKGCEANPPRPEPAPPAR